MRLRETLPATERPGSGSRVRLDADGVAGLSQSPVTGTAQAWSLLSTSRTAVARCFVHDERARRSRMTSETSHDVSGRFDQGTPHFCLRSDFVT